MKKLSKEEMKMVLGGDDEVDELEDGDGGDGFACKHAGDSCTKNKQCCSKSCGSSVGATAKYCDGA